MNTRTVVVVEDDDDIAELLDLYIEQAGFAVKRAVSGEEGLALIQTSSPVLAVIDIGLPGEIDGFEVCRRVRAEGELPMVLLTARGEETDRVVGLELGADDYVTKPFSPRELVARIKAILRRSEGPKPVHDVVMIDGLEVDLSRHEARVEGVAVDLTRREFSLLATLAENRGRALTRRQLLDLAWGYDWYGDDRTVDVHVRQLRRKLGEAAPITTVRGIGYRLD